MPRGFYKFKLLLDENFYPREKLPIANNRFKLRHILKDLHLTGISDSEVYKLAIKNKSIVVTFNDKHFKPFAETSKESGVIGISTNLSIEQIDKKLTALLTKSKKNELYAKFTYISD